MRLHPEWALTPERAAVHLPTATAVIADLHLGYDEARRRRGDAVPARPLAEALAPLLPLFARLAVRRLAVAGDLVEGVHAEALAGELAEWLRASGVELAGIVPGNHDRGLTGTRSALPVCPEGVAVGDWRVVHGDGALPRGRVVHGHLHPCLRWGRSVVAPCYLEGARRLVLPAFSVDAAGVGVLRDPRWRRCQCHAVVNGRVLDFGEVGKLGRALRQNA